MTIGVKTAARTAWCQELIDQIDAGTGAGSLKFYTSPRPSTGGTATTLLATIGLTDPCGTAANGVLTFNSFVDDTNAAASGVAAWARLADSDGNFVCDLSVGTVGSGSDIELSTTTITATGSVSVTSGTIVAGNS